MPSSGTIRRINCDSFESEIEPSEVPWFHFTGCPEGLHTNLIKPQHINNSETIEIRLSKLCIRDESSNYYMFFEFSETFISSLSTEIVINRESAIGFFRKWYGYRCSSVRSACIIKSWCPKYFREIDILHIIF